LSELTYLVDGLAVLLVIPFAIPDFVVSLDGTHSLPGSPDFEAPSS